MVSKYNSCTINTCESGMLTVAHISTNVNKIKVGPILPIFINLKKTNKKRFDN